MRKCAGEVGLVLALTGGLVGIGKVIVVVAEKLVKLI